MSQDKPVLTVEQIELKKKRIQWMMSGEPVRPPDIKFTLAEEIALCDLALSALDRQGWTKKQAQQLAAFREAHVTGEYAEAWHQIYWLVADQAADQYNPWAEVEALAPPHNDHEPPQVPEMPTSGLKGKQGNGPASGSPDVVERLEAQFYAGNDQIVLRDDCIRALRALEADRSVLRQQLGDSEKSSARDRLRLGDIKKVCESLQSELDRVRNLLDRAYKMMWCAGYRVVEHNPEHNNPIIAWMADARTVLGSDPTADLTTLGERG